MARWRLTWLIGLGLKAVRGPGSAIIGALGIRVVRFDLLGRHIGHLAIEPDCFVKEQLLGRIPKARYLLLMPRGRTANRCLARYWERHMRLLRSDRICAAVAAFVRGTALEFDIGRYAVAMAHTAEFPAIQRAWGRRPPLLKLDPSHEALGRQVLRDLGIPEAAWFVAVHCREAGSYLEPLHDYRNASIDSYIPAMQSITELGGWVIRMGDASMARLPPLHQVIDYAHLPIRSPEIDVFLCAAARFFLGSSSGLFLVSSIFGVPVVAANLAPLSHALGLYRPGDLGTPKLYWSIPENRYLSFREVLQSEFANYRYSELFDRVEVRVDSNTADEIRDLAIEMIASLAGRLYSDDDDALQARFCALLRPGHYSFGGISRIGSAFLRKHQQLLE